MRRNVLWGKFRIACCVAAGIAALQFMAIATPKRADAADVDFTCNPISVRVFPKKRIGVQCSPGNGAISFFALGVADPGDANRTLSLLTAAFTAKKKLTIWYDPADMSGSSIGCRNADCRLIRGVRMF